MSEEVTRGRVRITIAPVVSPDAIATVARLAHEIWYEHYTPIIGRLQVDYMVPRFQSEAAIADQQARGLEYHLLHAGQEPIGYFAFEEQPARACMFLSKLYVLSAWRGSGAARAALDFLESQCRKRNLSLLWLTVNRFNPAIHAYERLGFHTVGTVVADIGGGFVMDDYRMEKQL